MSASVPRAIPPLVLTLLIVSVPPALADPVISEIRIDNPGDDTDEYFELAGAPFESLDGLAYVVIGDADYSAGHYGVVETFIPLDGFTLGANGFLAIANDPFLAVCTGYSPVASFAKFENGDNVTHLLVRGASGLLGEDLDWDDDGTLDMEPWSEILDCVALIERTSGGDPVYCDHTVGPDRKHTLPIGGPREYVPAHVARCGPGWYVGNLYGDPPCANDSPGGPNVICGNVPPRVPVLTSRPCAPESTDPVVVEATVLDSNGDLSTVFLHYRVYGAPDYATVAMAPAGGQTWAATIGPYPDQTLLEFYVQATDVAQNTTTNPSSAPSYPRSFRIGLTPIPEIQASTGPVDECLYPSDLDGQSVNVTGIVTHRAGEFSPRFFYIQEGTEPFSGLKVYVPAEDFVPELGDRVVVSGVVEERRCQTQLRLFRGCGQVVGSEPVPIRTLAHMEEINTEPNESMLVTVDGPITVTSAWDTTLARNGREPSFLLRRFEISAGMYSVWVGDDTFYPDGLGYSYEPNIQDGLRWITGIVGMSPEGASYGILRLEPRRDPDVWLRTLDVPDESEPVVVDALRLDPARPSPTRAVTTIGFEVPVAGRVTLRIYDVAGRLVRELFEREYEGPARGETVWDGRDDAGRPVAAGAYLYRLEVGERSATRKIMLLR